MKPLVIVLSSLLIALCTVLPYNFVKAAQQCDSCTGDSCSVKTIKTEPCSESCYKLELRKDSPDDTDPFVVKGCTSDSLFYRRSCANRCYSSKREFGSGMYYMCVYCCTGDKCNQGSKAEGGVILITLVAFAVTKYLYFH